MDAGEGSFWRPPIAFQPLGWPSLVIDGGVLATWNLMSARLEEQLNSKGKPGMEKRAGAAEIRAEVHQGRYLMGRLSYAQMRRASLDARVLGAYFLILLAEYEVANALKHSSDHD